MSRRLATALAAAGLLACAHNIPNTEIRDTPDTRAIVAVIDDYRQALERRDAGAVLKLVSPQYFDDQGTPDPADDMDYAQLAKALPTDLAKLPAVRVDIGVKQVEVNDGKGYADLFFDSHYRVATPRAEIPKSASDVNRMTFRKENGAWKITSGL